jgi:hypothetical protein
VRSESVTNRSASRKLLFPAPFGPTRKVNGPSLTSHAARLLKFFRATLVKKVELVMVAGSTGDARLALSDLLPYAIAHSAPRQNNPFTILLAEFSESFQSLPGFATPQPIFRLLYQDQEAPMYNPVPPPRPSLLLLSSTRPNPMPPRAVSRIALQLSHLHECVRVFELPTRPGDASCEKYPQDASPNLVPPPQPIENTQLKTS